MLFRQRFLDGIRDGSIRLAFRRWRKPSVKAGGTLLTAVGQLDIVAVDEVAMTRISETDARQAGYESRADLLAELQSRDEGTIYRIQLGTLRPDPRVALRASDSLADDERGTITARLQRLDANSSSGPWTRKTLEIIRAHPGRRAGDLAAMLEFETQPFKVNVRKLKTLGLTESLEVGYRLSPRGVAFLDVEGALT